MNLFILINCFPISLLSNIFYFTLGGKWINDLSKNFIIRKHLKMGGVGQSGVHINSHKRSHNFQKFGFDQQQVSKIKNCWDVILQNIDCLKKLFSQNVVRAKTWKYPCSLKCQIMIEQKIKQNCRVWRGQFRPPSKHLSIIFDLMWQYDVDNLVLGKRHGFKQLVLVSWK